MDGVVLVTTPHPCVNIVLVFVGQGEADGRTEARLQHAERAAHLDAVTQELLRALYPFSVFREFPETKTGAGLQTHTLIITASSQGPVEFPSWKVQVESVV